MPGSVSNPVKLDHFQNIIEVGWGAPTPTYIITSARLTLDPTSVTVADEIGDDGFIYPTAPSTHGGLWTTSITVDYHNNVIPPYSPNAKFNSFDIYDQFGDYLETVTSSAVSAALPAIPVTTTFARFECFVETGTTPSKMDWDAVGADAHLLFPGFKVGSARMLFSRAVDFTGAEDKYTISGGTPWIKMRLKTGLLSKNAGDVSVNSAVYSGLTYAIIGVRLTEGPDLSQPNNWLQAEILLKRVAT